MPLYYTLYDKARNDVTAYDFRQDENLRFTWRMASYHRDRTVR